jgi:hypothetical protein
LKQARKRKSSDKDDEGEHMSDADRDELEEIPRSTGQKSAKKAAFQKKAANGNKKVNDSTYLEEIITFGKVQADDHANRLKVLEVQQKLSSEKIEQAKLAHLAAMEQKEAALEQKEARKLEVETKMFDTYNKLLTLDVSFMSAEDKIDHANTMRCLKKKIFADYN